MLGDREEILTNYGGVSKNDLNEILNQLNENEPEELLSYPQSSYVDIDQLMSFLKSNKQRMLPY